jgi:predicted lipoprotein with Yx(FWY)xxD motif
LKALLVLSHLANGGCSAADFDTITRKDGAKQTTYQGKPLYTFVRDLRVGDTVGEGFRETAYTVKAPISMKLEHSAQIGNYLTDGRGMTLYDYDLDPEEFSVCTKACLNERPVFYSDYAVVSSDLDAADFGYFTRKDGRKQSTYKGIPLYYYSKDAREGDILGRDIANQWNAIDPAHFNGTSVSNGKFYKEAE